jgi:hypothetical protein
LLSDISRAPSSNNFERAVFLHAILFGVARTPRDIEGGVDPPELKELNIPEVRLPTSDLTGADATATGFGEVTSSARIGAHRGVTGIATAAARRILLIITDSPLAQ